jgi:hypothetical protein
MLPKERLVGADEAEVRDAVRGAATAGGIDQLEQRVAPAAETAVDLRSERAHLPRRSHG